MSLSRIRARAWGAALEWRAALWLSLKGYRVIARNFRMPSGEIDIVALSPERWSGQGKLCFVEVRGRDSIESATQSVDRTKQMRVRRAATAFVAAHPRYATLPRRFDLVVAGRAGSLVHSRGAFDA